MKKYAICIVIVIFILWVAGCGAQSGSGASGIDSKTDEESAEQIKDETNRTRQETSDEVRKLCMEIYEETGTQPLEMMQAIIQKLGERGYSAVDSRNQIDMTRKEQVLSFCESVEQQKEASLTILVPETPEKLDGYYLSTENGNVEVVKEHYQYNNDCFEKTGSVSYSADTWKYTQEGYLIFTGSFYSEQSYVLTMSDVPEVTALRVEPLDNKCRELNRLYMLPIGYEKNNMFLCDWDEEDYGELEFYDVFDRFYAMRNGQAVPYVADENISTGMIYRIEQEEFETVLMEYLPADQDNIRSHTKYLPENKVYEYRPRGFYEAESPNIPYPEVIGYAANDDGTLTLTVNAVYPGEGTSKAYTHEVMIRPLQDGGFQYLSNKMLPSKDDYDTGWHTDRLTEKEWNDAYADKAVRMVSETVSESVSDELPQPYVVYMEVLEQIMTQYSDPTGRIFEFDKSRDKMEDSLFAIHDVDGDGRQELVFKFYEYLVGGFTEIIYSYDEKSGILREKFSAWGNNTYYDNGFFKTSFYYGFPRDSEDREICHYALNRYDETTDSYQVECYVSTWEQYAGDDAVAFSEDFPEELDTDGDGILYCIWVDEDKYVMSDYSGAMLMNRQEYEVWVEEKIPHFYEMNVTFHPAAAESVKGIETAYEQVKVYARHADGWLFGAVDPYTISYLLYDMNQDGRLELIVNLRQGSGMYSDNYFYTLTEDMEFVKLPIVTLCDSKERDWISVFDIASYEYMKAYRDDAGVIYYEGKDFVRDGSDIGYVETGFYYLKDGAVYQDSIRKSTIYSDVEIGEKEIHYYRMVTNFNTADAEEITAKTYEGIREDYVYGMTELSVYHSWVYFKGEEVVDNKVKPEVICDRFLESYLGSL